MRTRKKCEQCLQDFKVRHIIIDRRDWHWKCFDCWKDLTKAEKSERTRADVKTF